VKFVYHPRCLEHVQWSGHPERPERIKAIVERLEAAGRAPDFITPEPAGKRDVVKVHEEAFVERIAHAKDGPYDADTFLHAGTYQLALLAAGAALAAARHSLGKREEAFALTRPPGHHAGTSFAGGFCYFNNAAIAAHYLSHEEGLSPVAIVDLDVHHGNGTQEIFESRKDVVYLSTHQDGIYPGTGRLDEVGRGAGEGRIVNVPLPEGSGDATFRLAWERLLLPILEAAKPKAVIVSLGLDAHYEDPLAGLTLSSPAYIETCAALARFARERAALPAVFLLEGGYHLGALAETVAGVAQAVEGGAPATELNTVRDPRGVGRAAVERALKVQSAHWPVAPAP
jgi:acetoin utilization deacetylase AcuC-like enzyme